MADRVASALPTLKRVKLRCFSVDKCGSAAVMLQLSETVPCVAN